MDKDKRIKEIEDENAKLKDELQTTKEHLKKSIKSNINWSRVS